MLIAQGQRRGQDLSQYEAGLEIAAVAQQAFKPGSDIRASRVCGCGRLGHDQSSDLLGRCGWNRLGWFRGAGLWNAARSAAAPG